MASLLNLLNWRRPVGVTKTVTPQPNPIADAIDAALDTRRRARAARAAAANAGHAARKAQRLPDPILAERRA